MESLLRQAIDGLEAISFSLRIRNGRIQVGARVPDGDLIRETGGDLIRLEERADNALPREIRLFGELALNPLGMRIADVLQETHPAVFSLLHQAAEAARGVPEPFIRGFMEDIRFYTRYLDVARELRAKGLPFACPALSGDEVRITGAYDMELALKQEQVVVNDCRLSPDERGIIITGANHSGKTTYIRAIGQIAALTALGLPVPCAEAKIPLFKQFFSHFSDAERGEARQGRLMEELDKLKPICKQMEEGSFVLLNEMFSSTTAQDAQGLAKRILDNFVDQGARVLCVTHTMEQIPKRMVSMAAQVAPGSHKRLYTVVRAPTEIHAHIDVLIDQYGLTYQAIKERIGYDV
jgi:hypothetical protein